MNLIEVMLAAMIGGGLSLTLGAATQYATVAMNTYQTRTAVANFNNRIKYVVQNKKPCGLLITAPTSAPLIPNPPDNSPTQSIWLSLPSTTAGAPPILVQPTGIGDGVPIESNINIVQTSLTKLMNANSGTTPSYTANGYEFYPILGQVNILVRNMAVTRKAAFGDQDTLMSFPMSLTFKRLNAASPWTIDQCGAVTSNSLMDKGWNLTNFSDPTSCVQNLFPPQVCPIGMYMITAKPEIITTTTVVPVTTTTWASSYPENWDWDVHQTNPTCKCTGSLKGFVCVAGSRCNAICNGAQGIVTYNNCMGTCNANTNCQATTTTTNQTITTQTPTVRFSCCRVRK